MRSILTGKGPGYTYLPAVETYSGKPNVRIAFPWGSPLCGCRLIHGHRRGEIFDGGTDGLEQGDVVGGAAGG